MTDLTPIRKDLAVPLRPDEAFRLFAERMEEWWPLDTHSLSAGRGEVPLGLRIEGREGGHIVETKPDGSEGIWGRIEAWEPGRRLAISWHVGRAPEEATRIEVVFRPTDTGTRIELTHGGWQVLAAAGGAARASYFSGWDHVLGHYKLLVGAVILA